MELRDPVLGYKAASNMEARLILLALANAGIDASIVEDTSTVSTWNDGGGTLQNQPQVWIERGDIERAAVVVREHERRAAERRSSQSDAPPIEVTCESCGKTSSFPAMQEGSVQNCPHCMAYVDVGDDVGFEGWEDEGEGEGQEQEQEDE